MGNELKECVVDRYEIFKKQTTGPLYALAVSFSFS